MARSLQTTDKKWEAEKTTRQVLSQVSKVDSWTVEECLIFRWMYLSAVWSLSAVWGDQHTVAFWQNTQYLPWTTLHLSRNLLIYVNISRSCEWSSWIPKTQQTLKTRHERPQAAIISHGLSMWLATSNQILLMPTRVPRCIEHSAVVSDFISKEILSNVVTYWMKLLYNKLIPQTPGPTLNNRNSVQYLPSRDNITTLSV